MCFLGFLTCFVHLQVYVLGQGNFFIHKYFYIKKKKSFILHRLWVDMIIYHERVPVLQSFYIYFHDKILIKLNLKIIILV